MKRRERRLSQRERDGRREILNLDVVSGEEDMPFPKQARTLYYRLRLLLLGR